MPTGAIPGRHSRHVSSQSITSPASPSAAFLVTEKMEDATTGLSAWRLAGLTCSILGVQIFWSILMAHGTSYLTSLGFSSSLTSLVWMAGPLGGVFIQPIVGVWSDRYKISPGSRWESLGRRKPFILAGAAGVIICSLGLATVREGLEILGLFLGMRQHELDEVIGEEGHGSVLLVLAAMIWVYALNIAIQPLQAGIRAFVVDNVPPSQQSEANAWLSRWNCFGAVFAFWLGSIDLPRLVPFLGKTQFKSLCIVEVVVLLVTIPISFLVDPGLAEKPSNEEAEPLSISEIFRSLYRTYRAIPHTSWTVFKVQFWSWMAWFPFLYYNTVYIGSLSKGRTHEAQTYGDLAQELMSRAMPQSRSHYPPSMGSDPNAIAAQTGSYASFVFALTSLAFTIVLPFLTHRVRFLSIERLWFISHIIFACIMVSTCFVETIGAGIVLFAGLGFSWAMTQWAPFALISAEVSRMETEAREDRENGWEEGVGPGRAMAGAGAVFGLHNVAIAGPQVFAAIECAGLFKLFASLGDTDEIGSVLRWTALAALGGAWVGRKLLK